MGLPSLTFVLSFFLIPFVTEQTHLPRGTGKTVSMSNYAVYSPIVLKKLSSYLLVQEGFFSVAYYRVYSSQLEKKCLNKYIFDPGHRPLGFRIRAHTEKD